MTMETKFLEMITARNQALKEVNEKRIADGNNGINRCAWDDCDEFADITRGMGIDTSCPYHRLLFDHWLYNVSTKEIRDMPREERNKLINKWVKETGKDECDKIVDAMSRDYINWQC